MIEQRAPRRMLAALVAALVTATRFPANAAVTDDTALPATPLAFATLSLSAAESAALDNSPDLSAARARVAELSAALRGARATLAPALAGSYVLAPQGGGLHNSMLEQHLTTVQLQESLGDLFSYSPVVEQAAAAVYGAQADELVAERTERLKVVGLYYDALRLRVQSAAQDSALQLATAQRDAAALRVSAGDAPHLDLVRAQVAVLRAQAASATAKAADENATAALAVETGADPATLAQTAAGQPFSTAPLPAPQAAAAEALRTRADLRSASSATLAAQAVATAAARGSIPAITLGAGYASGVDSGQFVHGPAVNVSLVLPLSPAAYDRAAAGSAAVRESRAKEAALRRTIAVEAAAAARTAGAAVVAGAASRDALAQAREELQATILGYRSGVISSLEVTSARDTYVQALLDALSATYDEVKALATLDLEMHA